MVIEAFELCNITAYARRRSEQRLINVIETRRHLPFPYLFKKINKMQIY